ncbi:MAG: hypothetical protein Q8P18_02835 [Pseudomonadota bacterium]|nr:hypothetical protein [Pseudomonadota bacterium]
MTAPGTSAGPHPLLDLDDAAPLDRDKAAEALRRLRIAEVRDPDGPEFAAAYEMLAGFFLANGELEERGALAGFVRDRVLAFGEGLEGVYHLVAAWDGDQLVGVRDCYVDIDHVRGVCVVALSHSYVAPSHRRSGLAAAFRALPVTLARRVVAERVGRPLPTLVVAEMEPVDPAQPETIVRLLAYGRSGFRVLDPVRVPYSQPEFRDLPDAAHTAIPLLGVVRPIGLDGLTELTELPVHLAASFPRLFHACHRLYLPDAKVSPSERHVTAALHATPAPVSLLPLPTARDTLARLAPLVRGAVLPLFPPPLRGPNPGFGDPAEELEGVLAGWSG